MVLFKIYIQVPTYVVQEQCLQGIYHFHLFEALKQTELSILRNNQLESEHIKRLKPRTNKRQIEYR